MRRDFKVARIMAARICLRANSRVWPRLLSSYAERVAAEEVHAVKTKQMWKRFSLFICVPTVAYFAWKNLIHSGEGHGDREYIPWSHLRIRTKPFPWGDGDTSLLHNPHTNPRPGGEPPKALPALSLKQRIGKLWIEYLHEDPEERGRERWEHLAKMQRVREEHLARKRTPDVPIHPMDLTAEVKTHKPNPAHSGINN